MKLQKFSRQLIRLSMLAYVLWLMPAVRTTGGAIAGAACILLFGLGVLMDVEALKKEWLHLLGRAACAALMPLFLIRFLNRGGEQPLGFYVQNAMMWFPLVFAGHVRSVGDKQLWKFLRHVLLGATVITLLTTIGWLIEGFFSGVYGSSYSRMLGNGDADLADYRKMLMLRNIGGYDFIYAMVISLPFSFIGMERSRGWRRWAFVLFIILQLAAIGLSEYTSALLCSGMILFVECAAALIRIISRKRVSAGASLLCGCLLLLVPVIFAKPLLTLLIQLSGQLELTFVTNNLNQVLTALQGGAISSSNRLSYYLTALEGIRQSPITGALFGGEKLLSYHSDIMDLISGTGILGACAAGVMFWLMGRGSLRGWKQHPCKWQLCTVYGALLLVSTLGTVVYSCDIMSVVMLGTLLVMES